MAKTKGKTPKPAPEELEDDDDVELEELDEDAEEDEAPAKSKKGGAEEVEFGASDLARHLSEKTGKTITPRELRAFIRKLAREDNPRVQREVVAGNRSRYNWPGGLKNPEVKAIIKAVTGGELEASKKEALDKLKEQKAAKKASGDGGSGKKGKKGKKAKRQPEPEPEDDDDEIEDDEIEVDDDDE